jgi:hypothetical protein
MKGDNNETNFIEKYSICDNRNDFPWLIFK